MTPVQCRMARAALEMSIEELAKEAKCSPTTLVRFESGKLRGARKLSAVQRALESAGCVFLREEASRGVGVYLKRAAVTAADLTGRIEKLESHVAAETDGPPSPADGMRLLEVARRRNVAVRLKNRRATLLEGEQR